MSTPKKSAVRTGGWRGEFDRAFSDGRFKDAADFYKQNAGGSEPSDLVLLGARAAMHADPPVALGMLLKLESNQRRVQATRDLLLAEAFARTKDFKSADKRLAAALKAANELADSELLAEIGYRFVRRHLHDENPTAAWSFLELTRSGTSHTARVYSLYAETLVLPYEGRAREQADRLVELLRILDPRTPAFMDIRAWGAHALAVLAREIHLPDAIPEIERQLTGVPWTNDFAANLFQTMKALGWAKALQGDYFNAFRHLKSASTVADTTAWKVVAACDRSALARSVGEYRWSRLELDEAEQLASTVNWHATLGEERAGLLLMAELFSSLDSSRSAMYLSRYRELGDIKSPLHYKHDARLHAFSQYSTAVVELALGNKKRALAELRESLKVFEAFGYDFRAARCLITEYGVTHNRDLLQSASEKLRNYGQSWLAGELRSQGQQPDDVTLPPMQKRVFDELCRGKSNAEIAQSLKRSEFTISNHIKQIFKTFDVGSRSALIAEAARRGLLGQP